MDEQATGESCLNMLVVVAVGLAVMACVSGCSVTVSYDLPSKTIQDYFFAPKKK